MTESTKRTPLPDVADIIFLLVLQLALYLKPDYVFTDGSTGWHLVTGNYIIDTHTIPHTDLMSYTFANKAWVAYEWLSDWFMALLVKWGGLNLLSVVVCNAIALLFLLLYGRCRKNGSNFVLATVLCLIGAIVSSVHWLARPILFTFFGVYLFATKLEDFWRGTISGVRLGLWIVLYMLLWVNTHPGFLFGFVILAIYLFSAILQYFLVNDEETKNGHLNRVRTISIVSLIALVATFCNPYFSGLFTYINSYLHSTNVLAASQEFGSPTFHGELQASCLEILFALFAIGLAVTRRGLSLPQLITCLVFIHLSLSGLRNMPLATIILLPAIAQLFSITIFSAAPDESSPWLKSAIRATLTKFERFNRDFTANEIRCNMHILPICAFVVLAAASLFGGKLFGMDIVQTTFDEKHKPTKTLTEITKLGLNPKEGFNFDNWGGYIRYKLNIPVFIDDRADFYGEQFYREYSIVCQVQPGWMKVLDKYGIKWVLFPSDSKLAAMLKTDPRWTLATVDEASCLYVRKNTTEQNEINSGIR